ncbi:MAG: hypothetical protein F3739_02255 [Nitrospinae bacterium]|nr:hypothetical protein [Nitrospinota bacterium]
MIDKASLHTGSGLPFPVEWVNSQPRKVEDILSDMSVEGQARCIMGLAPDLQHKLLMLSEMAVEVTQSLPVEEVYNLIKHLDREDSLLVVSMVSPDQLQYVFDLEWWQGDKFQPRQAMDWIILLDQCQDPETLEWFSGEDFDQKVMLLQALLLVFKKDEMTDAYEGVEGLEHFSPDGVYDIYFKVESNKEIRKLLLLLYEKDQTLFYNLLEAVIWYPITPTLEKAYQWRMVRTAERGIPEFQEAMGIYSRLDPETLKLKLPSLEDFPSSRLNLSPRYPLAQLDESLFFTQCLGMVENEQRHETMLWELVCLSNKVIVADGYELSSKDVRERAMRKALGYINMGLELGAERDLQKGASLLNQVWMQSLFQVGYEQLRQIRSTASTFINENGSYIEHFISDAEKERLGALVFRFPQVVEKSQESFIWRDLQSLSDIEVVNEFLVRWKFYSRFARQGLGLRESTFISLKEISDDVHESMNLLSLVTTALAQYVLFKKISCDPLPEVAAKSFLELIFLPGIFQDEAKLCNDELIASFEQELLKAPMAWTDFDKKCLQSLLQECTKNLENQFGRLDLTKPIDWKFTQGLSITHRTIN